MAAQPQKKTEHRETQTNSSDIDGELVIKLKHDFDSLSKHMNSLGKIIENIEHKINNERKLNDLIETSRIEQETKNIEKRNVKNNLEYLKELVNLVEEENVLVVQKKKLELELQKALGDLDTPPDPKPSIPPPLKQTKSKSLSVINQAEQKEEKNDIQPPRKSMSIEGDLRSALQNKFKNAGTGFDSD